MSLKYTEDHEWVDVDGDIATVGVSVYAVGQLGDIVFTELPGIGVSFKKGDDVAVVESVKAASDVYTPVSGEITAVNLALEDAPETVNDAPEGAGWFFKIKLSNASELDGLMDEAAYKTFCEGL